MLRVESLDLSYGASRCLRGVSLEADPGRITCVLGRNGVGKSSLMRAIVGLERAQSGRILWEGRDVAGLAPAERARAGIGYVPQGREIFPLLTVQENLVLGFMQSPGRSRAEDRRSASVMIRSSISVSLAGFDVLWMMNMSSPRTFSKTSTKISWSLKRSTRACDWSW